METADSLPDIPDGPCIENRARTNSMRLGTRHINLRKLADNVSCSEGYLSRAFRDINRNLSVTLLRRIATQLQISTDDLIVLMEERKKNGNRPLSLQ